MDLQDFSLGLGADLGLRPMVSRENKGFKISLVQPDSIDKTKATSYFWRSILNKDNGFVEDYNVEQVNFVYQTKDTVKDLPFFKKGLNRIGFEFRPDIIEGETVYDSFSPVTYMGLVGGSSSFVLDLNDYKKFSELSKNTYDFIVKKVLTVDPLAKRIDVPLETIVGLNIKDTY